MTRIVVRFYPAVAVCALVLCNAVALADAMAAYPDHVQLDNTGDTQRVVVQQTRDDGVTLDQTGAVAVSFAPDGIAKWTEDHRVAPVADGDTVMTMKAGDKSVTVPVKVKNVAKAREISFRNDVEPVMMRSGCNMGSCHGSAQGKNGFHLSLFGYDPGVDYLALTRQERARRMNEAEPHESLMLQKPAGQVDHDGGTRFAPDSGLYAILTKWIANGAKDDPADLPKLTGIELVPHACVLEGEGAPQQFVVKAAYSDGTDRDVTDLAVLSSSDELTVTLNKDTGLAKAGGRGEAYIMARFGSFAVISQVITLPKDLKLQWPDAAPKNYVDELVFAKLKKLRIPPAELCTDAVFVRRVYLDVLGVLPTPAETQSFIADTAPDKRAKLVDALLQRPEFPALWAMKWAELLRVQTNPVIDRKAMHRYNDWIRQSIASNKPIDQMVKELLTAQGGNFTEAAANFYLTDPSPNQMAENVAQVYLGIQIKCAQCHNHPFERWTMDDYYSFAAFFAQVGRKPSSDPRETIVFDSRSGEVANLKNGVNMAPKFLGGAAPDCSGKDRRALLADWLTAPDNPWFAKCFANRIWHQFFGMGIIDPPDDVRATNPPSNPELLDELAKKLLSYHYDMHGLVKDICNSYTYQMSSHPRDPAIVDTKNFSHSMVRRLPAEQLLDAIASVTETKVKFANLPLGARAAEVADGNSGNYFLELFGRPARVTVSVCERRNEPTLGQTLHLINGDTINTAIRAAGGRLEQLASSKDSPADVVGALYMAAYSRTPTDEEKAQVDKYVTGSPDRKTGLEDVMWSILNSKEFVFNH